MRMRDSLEVGGLAGGGETGEKETVSMLIFDEVKHLTSRTVMSSTKIEC